MNSVVTEEIEGEADFLKQKLENAKQFESKLPLNCRCEAREKAERARERLMVIDTIELREQITDTAQESGMLSIWWEVFAADVDMRQRLRLAFF